MTPSVDPRSEFVHRLHLVRDLVEAMGRIPRETGRDDDLISRLAGNAARIQLSVIDSLTEADEQGMDFNDRLSQERSHQEYYARRAQNIAIAKLNSRVSKIRRNE